MSPVVSPRAAHIVHVITGLGQGGAETLLVDLLGRADRARFSHEVVSLLPGGANAERVREMGIPLTSLNLHKRLPDPRAVVRLARMLRQRRPDIVHTWLYHADLIGGLAARAAGVPSVLWALHNSSLPPNAKLTTRMTVELCARLSSHLPSRVLSCSRAGIQWHVARGYPADRMVLVENGFDVERFRPDAAARQSARRELGASQATALVGLPARVAPEKDHRNFLDAARVLLQQGRDIRFVLCGDGATPDNRELAQWIDGRGLRSAVLLLGRRPDMERILAGLDVVCSSSSHVEAFSMAIGEALASGVPCVATDVGDVRALLDGIGVIVPPRSPEALARGIATMLDETAAERAARVERGRRHVAEQYSLESCARRYAALYERLLEEGASSGPIRSSEPLPRGRS